MSRAILFLTALIATLHQTIALNILVIVSMPIPSHYMAFQSLFRELALRGHKVTVMNNFPDKQPTPGLEFINLEAYQHMSIASLEYYESLDLWYAELYNAYRHLLVSPDITARDCEILFTNKKMKEHLKRGVKYDVVFVEQFMIMSDCGLAYSAALYDAPIIGITSHVLLPKHYPRLGIPYDVTTDPFYFSTAGTRPSLLQRVEVTVLNFLFHTYMKWSLENSLSNVFAKYLPEINVDLEKMSKEKMVMLFSYQHHSITGGRLLAPQLLEIAGTHIQKPKPVPKNIEDFLSSAEHGVVYVSFGSILKAHTMSDRKKQHFLEAFRRIPQKVIWRWENATFTERDIFTSNWLPQLDVLCHPKVVAFITHGGMLSMSEAAHCSTPLLTVPFFGDQYSNAASARESGLGLTMFFADINSDNLVEAIRELTSEKMQANANRISRLWHDRPQPVMESAIYWTEYVARHRDVPPHLPAKLASERAWFNTSLLDVACVIIALLFVILFIIYAILRFLLTSIWKLFAKVVCKKTKSD